MQRYVLICYSSKQKLLELPNQDLASFFFNSCTLLTNFKSNSNSNQIFRMTETAYFPDLICLNRILKKSVDLTVPSASLLTVASFLKQFFKLCLGREGGRKKRYFQLWRISENCGVMVKLLSTLKGVLHSSKMCSNTQIFVMCTGCRGGGCHILVSTEVFQTC